MDKKESWIFMNYDFINSILKPNNRVGLDIFVDLPSKIDIISTNIMLDTIDTLGNINNLDKKRRNYHKSMFEFLDLYIPEFLDIFKDNELMNYYSKLYNSERNKLEDKFKKDKIVKKSKNNKLLTNLKKTNNFKKTKSK